MVFFYRKRARAASPVPSNPDMADNRTSQGSSFVRGVFPQGADGNGLGRQNTYTDNRMKNVYPQGSRDSSVSLQDNEDYSRPVLRVSGPRSHAETNVHLLTCFFPRLPTPIKSGSIEHPAYFLRVRFLEILLSINSCANSPKTALL